MKLKILELIPKSFLCPYCGEWHSWSFPHELGYYDSKKNPAILVCPYYQYGYAGVPVSKMTQNKMLVFFDDNGLHVSTVSSCTRGYFNISTTISINDIVESSDEPRVTFSVPYTPSNEKGRIECFGCFGIHQQCLIYELDESRQKQITSGFCFWQSDYDEFVKSARKKFRTATSKQTSL